MTEPIIYKLIIPSNKWKFDLPFPEHFETQYGYKLASLLSAKIWFIKKTIRYSTNFKLKTIPITNNLKEYIPRGLNFFNSNLTDDIMNKTYESLEKIFKNYKKYDIPYSDQSDNRGLTYLFTSDQVMYASDALLKMKDIDPFLANVCLKVITVIYKKFGLSVDIEEALKSYITCVLLKYNPDFGIWLHIDNVARYKDEGPICGLSIGPKFSYMDFAPSLLHKEEPKLIPIRAKIPQGIIYSMDGSSRMEWSHGLPFDTPYEKNKYTIMIKCNKFNIDGNKSFNKILNTEIVESKIYS